MGPLPLEASRSVTGVAASERTQTYVRSEGVEEVGIALAAHDLVESAPHMTLSSHDVSPAKSLQQQVAKLDDEVHTSALEQTPSALEEGVCTLMVAISLLMGVGAINISAWLWDVINSSIAELRKWSSRTTQNTEKS